MAFHYPYNGSLVGSGKVGKQANFNMENSRTARTALPTLPPTDVIDETGQTLSYYAPNSVPGLVYGSMNEGANATIIRAWSKSSYLSRTYAPCTCVLLNRGNNQTSWPYGGNNFQSAWWLQTSSPTDALIVELATTIFILRVEIGSTREAYSAGGQGTCDVTVVTKADGNQVTEWQFIGSANLPTNKSLVSVAINRSARMFIFRRSGNTGFSRLEKIRIIGS